MSHGVKWRCQTVADMAWCPLVSAAPEKHPSIKCNKNNKSVNFISFMVDKDNASGLVVARVLLSGPCSMW